MSWTYFAGFAWRTSEDWFFGGKRPVSLSLHLSIDLSMEIYLCLSIAIYCSLSICINFDEYPGSLVSLAPRTRGKTPCPNLASISGRLRVIQPNGLIEWASTTPKQSQWPQLKYTLGDVWFYTFFQQNILVKQLFGWPKIVGKNHVAAHFEIIVPSVCFWIHQW